MQHDDLIPNCESDFLLLSRISPICDAFESEFQRGSEPLIEDYLIKGQVTDRKELLFELLKLDLEYRQALGKSISLPEYLARFPNEEECVRSIFNEAETIDSDPIKTQSPKRAANDLPKRLGNYELLEVLGQGGMGVVYRAVLYVGDAPFREVALKLIRIDQWFGVADARSSELIARFREEARNAAQLKHPNITRVYDVGQLDGLDYFSMELIAGTDLTQLMENRPLSFSKIAETLIPVAQAIAYAHDLGIVHRDLKPSNILIDIQGKPYIADFGLAKSTTSSSDLTHTGQILGTPGYMAPEQAAGEYRHVGPSADIYGLGGLLYFCLTAQAPFVAANILDALVQVLERDPIPPRILKPTVPRSLELICMRCLEKKAEDRYATPMEVAEDLDRFLNGLPTQAQAPTIIERLRRFGRRSPVISIHLGALGLMLLLGQVQFATGNDATTLIEHLEVTFVMLAWIAMSVFCGFLTGSKKWESIAATFWLCADAVFLTVLIAKLSDPSNNPPGTLLIGYPMIVVGGGMFFQARMVILVTIASMLSFVGLLVFESDPSSPFRNAVFLILLACIGICSLHHVRRFRRLNDYVESRRGNLL